MKTMKPLQSRLALIILGIVLWITPAAHADTLLISNLFSGTNTGAANVGIDELVALGATQTALVGPGYNATVTLGVGVGASLAVAINNSNDGFFTLTEGGVLGVAGSFSASKTFTDTGTILAPDTTYDIGLVGQSNAALELLTTLNLQITQGSTLVADTSTGTGLLGIVNVVSLFGSGTTATLQFTTPNVIDTSAPFTLTLSGALPLSALSESIVLTGADLTEVTVPEPPGGALLAMGLFLGGVALLRQSHRGAAPMARG